MFFVFFNKMVKEIFTAPPWCQEHHNHTFQQMD